jgi:hypothetical protein
MHYLAVCFLSNVAMVSYWCLLTNPCKEAGSIFKSMANAFGEAFLCGALQIASYFMVTLVVAVEAYCLWVVWSLCEDVHQGRNGPELSELIPGKEETYKNIKRHMEGPRADIVGFASSTLPGPYPNAYGAISTPGQSGRPIFGGTAHETDYPPRYEDDPYEPF